MEIIEVAAPAYTAPNTSAPPTTFNDGDVRPCTITMGRDYMKPDPENCSVLERSETLSWTGTLWAGTNAFEPGVLPLAFGFGEDCSSGEYGDIVAGLMQIADERGFNSLDLLTEKAPEPCRPTSGHRARTRTSRRAA